MNIQEGNISCLPSILLMDDFCFSPISIMLVLLAIGYFQEKHGNTLKEKYFLDQLTGSGNQILTNLIILKLFDYVLFLANNSLNNNITKSFGSFFVENRFTFDELVPYVFSSVKLIESSRIDLTHRTHLIDNENDLHSNSLWTTNFIYNFTMNSIPLSSYLEEKNLNKNLKEILRIVYYKVNRIAKFESATGNLKKELCLNEYSKAFPNLLKFCLQIHEIDMQKAFIYKFNQIDDKSKLENITFISSTKIKSLKKQDFIYKDFFQQLNVKSRSLFEDDLDDDLYVISLHPISNLENCKLQTSNANQVFIFNEFRQETDLKFVQYSTDFYILKKNVNLEFLLNLKQSLDEEYKLWNFSSTMVENAIPINYTNKKFNKFNSIDEFILNKKDSNQIIVFKASIQEPVDLKFFFDIECNSRIYKEQKDLNYEFFIDNRKNYNCFVNELENINKYSIKPNYPFDDQKKTAGKIDKIKLKKLIPVDLEFRENESIESSLKKSVYEITDSSSNFDNSLLLNLTNSNLEKLRLLIIKIETLIVESCKHFKLNAKIKLLEYISIMHFKKYPYMYIMCPEITELVPYYDFFKDIYVNNFTINIEELNKLLEKTHNLNNQLQKFKEHYAFLCKRSLPLKKFGNLIKNERGGSNLHILALYIVHCQLKLAGDISYDNFKC